MAHGVEPLMPFDLSEATFLVEPMDAPLTTAELIAIRARQLLKRDDDLELIHERVLASRHRSVKEFEKKYANTIKDYDFQPGAIVLVRNTKVEKELSRKTKPCYLGPLMVVRRTRGGSYILAELDGSISLLRFAAFRLIPYFPRSQASYSVPDITRLSQAELDALDDTIEGDGTPEEVLDEVPDSILFAGAFADC